MENRWNEIDRGKRTYSCGKTCPIVTLSTTNPTWTDPGLRGERPATNRLSRGTAFRLISVPDSNLVSGSPLIFFFNGSTAPWGPRPTHFSRLHDHILLRHATLGRTPLDEGSARRRDLYLTTHNTHNRQTSMP
jgi:hypothetical protein